MFNNLIEKLYKTEFKLILDFRLKRLDYHSLGYTLYNISKYHYNQDIQYIIDLNKMGKDIVSLLNTYNIIYENKKILKATKRFTEHFNTIPHSLHLINTKYQLNQTETDKLFREIIRSEKYLNIINKSLPKISNIFLFYFVILLIGFIIGQFFQLGTILPQLLD